ncbi:hypothetical protein MTO96_037869 [Rhipicephalus appendiculatus]
MIVYWSSPLNVIVFLKRRSKRNLIFFQLAEIDCWVIEIAGGAERSASENGVAERESRARECEPRRALGAQLPAADEQSAYVLLVDSTHFRALL